LCRNINEYTAGTVTMNDIRSAGNVAINSSRFSAGMITAAPPTRAAINSCELQPVT
jgi:hypothetical protein